MKSNSHFRFIININKLPIFFQLLRKGIFVAVEQRVGIKALLCEKLKIDAAYIDKEVKTIFLNGKPVDDPDSAVIEGGSTLALSAAMPGMVGATMRSGGYYAPLRHAISFDRRNAPDSNMAQSVTVKCFNTVASDLGAFLLHQGVSVAGKDFQEFVDTRIDDFLKEVKSLVLDGKAVEPAVLKQIECSRENIFLQIETDPNANPN